MPPAGIFWAKRNNELAPLATIDLADRVEQVIHGQRRL